MPKRKQLQIAGTEPKTVAEVDEAALAYVEKRNERMALTVEEVEARATLIETLKKHEITDLYRFSDGEDEFEVDLVATEKVKVRKRGSGASAEGEPE